MYVFQQLLTLQPVQLFYYNCYDIFLKFVKQGAVRNLKHFERS